MSTTASAPSLQASDVLKRAHAVGTYYGFVPFAAMAAANKKLATKGGYPENLVLDTLDGPAREAAGFLKSVRDAGLTPSIQTPLFLWHSNAAAGRPAPKQIVVQFHILGVEHPIADAVLIRAMRSLIGDLGKGQVSLRVNSMGDKETRGRFSRELNQFFRKQGAELSPECVACARRDVFEAAEMICSTNEACEGFPSPTDHLSEASRKHFENLLEYLEATETPYELSPNLLSRGMSWSETCFEVRSDDGLHAWGSRYSELAKHFFKNSLPSVAAVVRINTDTRDTIAPVKADKQPRFVFVHIGDEAKRESMKMADDLRKARIPLTQAIGIQSLSEQMRFADGLNPQYLLIMGRKEALERSVIMRERSSHTETFIPLDSLIERLKAVA
jgi:histidyl-tRNA synthetase